MSSISDLRKEYSLKSLTKKDVDPDPVRQFGLWFEEARASISGEPNAMILSTCGELGRPSSRVVLLKGFSSDGFLFFTNYQSRKGSELEKNPYASLLFFWPELERQVRIEGKTRKVSRQESANYFSSRPRLSQVGAFASLQSSVIESRKALEEKFHDLEKKYTNQAIPLPENWGGYLLVPDYFEFWQGRRNRLHDRICYSNEPGKWRTERLSP